MSCMVHLRPGSFVCPRVQYSLKGALEAWNPKPIPKFKNPKRGVQYVFEGAPYDLNPKPAPKI